MQFEDSTGCLWTEEQDAEGYVYYVNGSTMVSTAVASSSHTTRNSKSGVPCKYVYHMYVHHHNFTL